ncbi:hypothetical protein HYV70_05160 [Candidatus Uhrbacteria bacterium]|nr:hypothetical protein [Candidatus Uhrbacteria bacterium]
MSFAREVFFGKVDLDTLVTSLVLGLNPSEILFKAVAGSVSEVMLADTSVMAIEVGGSGRVAENNFDHHSSKGGTTLSSAAQALERLARLVRYVDELDRGDRRAEYVKDGGFPSLSQLISGMLLVEHSPNVRMERGLELLKVVLHSGIDPFGSMDAILDFIPQGRLYASTKREHDRQFEEMSRTATWYTTNEGRRFAVVETSWIGALGVLYGKGADIVLALNPEMSKSDGNGSYKKFTLAVNRSVVDITVFPVLEELLKLEEGWGGPNHGGICGSPVGRNSELEIQQVVQIVIEKL